MAEAVAQESAAGAQAAKTTALERAAQLRRHGAPQDAEAVYHQILAHDRDELQALLGLGHCAQQRGDPAAALTWFAAAAAAHPANPWPHLYAGEALRQLGRVAEAEAEFRRALTGDGPYRMHALLGLGHCAQARADHAEALASFEAAAAAGPANPWPQLYAGHELRHLGRAEEAAAAYRRALEGQEAPVRMHAQIGLGLLARERGARAEAAALFEAAAATDPAHPAPRLELAAELRDRGEDAQARRIAEELLARNPRDIAAWNSLVQTHQSAGAWEEALGALRRLAEIDPARADTWIDLALAERRLGRTDAAVAGLERALACAPEYARALENLGELARLTRDFDKSVELFRRAVAAHPDKPWPRIGLSHTLADLGRLAEAMEVLDAAEDRLPPGDATRPGITAKRVELLRRAGHWTRALDLARRGGAAWPRHFALWVQRFMVEMLAGDRDSVAACLDAAPADTLQDRARVAQFRGQAAEARWALDDAVAHYADALALTPNDAWKHQNMARVRLLRLELAEARAHLATMVRLDADFATLMGRLPRVSWTHYGEILNEFALDDAVPAARRVLEAQPAAARIAPLLAVMRDFPDSTAAAIALLIALRQAGRLARPDARGLSPIPRTIAQYWDSPAPPPDVLALMRTWQDWHPDHAIERFDDARAQAFLADTYAPDVLLAYRRAREPAQKADLFRLGWLFARGGFYVDCDDRCHAPLTDVVPATATLALYQEDLGTLGNNIIGTVPQHPLFGRALDLAVAAVNAGGGDGVWLGTGPGLLTRAFAEMLATSRLSWSVWLERAAVLDRGEMYRAVEMHCFVGYKVTERHWSQAGARRRRDKVDVTPFIVRQQRIS
jgi:tetratricopeptide (TPR) repeat protein